MPWCAGFRDEMSEGRTAWVKPFIYTLFGECEDLENRTACTMTLTSYPWPGLSQLASGNTATIVPQCTACVAQASVSELIGTFPLALCRNWGLQASLSAATTAAAPVGGTWRSMVSAIASLCGLRLTSPCPLERWCPTSLSFPLPLHPGFFWGGVVVHCVVLVGANQFGSMPP